MGMRIELGGGALSDFGGGGLELPGESLPVDAQILIKFAPGVLADPLSVLSTLTGLGAFLVLEFVPVLGILSNDPASFPDFL